MSIGEGQGHGQTAGAPVYGSLVASLVLFAVGGVALSQTGTRTEDWVFPRVLCYALLATGAILAARVVARLVRGGGLGRVASSPEERQGTLDVGVFCLLAITYVVLEDGAGFWLTSFLMLVGCSLFLSARRNRTAVLISVGAAAIVCAAAYVVFLRFFYVPLPSGSWW